MTDFPNCLLPVCPFNCCNFHNNCPDATSSDPLVNQCWQSTTNNQQEDIIKSTNNNSGHMVGDGDGDGDGGSHDEGDGEDDHDGNGGSQKSYSNNGVS